MRHQMKNNNLTIRILNNTSFPDAYEAFLLDRDMTIDKYRMMLSLAILFLNGSSDNVQKLGYRIIVIYCNRMGDYKPLYDIAINTGLVPVAQFIEERIIALNEDKNIFTELNAAFNFLYLEYNIMTV